MISLIAEPLYLAGYIERIGTGTTDMVSWCTKAGLKEPVFMQEVDFRSILYRTSTEQVTEQATEQVQRMLLVLDKEMTRKEIMSKLDLKHRPTFLYTYLQPALDYKWIEMTIPEKANDPNQKYRLTPKGQALKEQLIKNN